MAEEVNTCDFNLLASLLSEVTNQTPLILLELLLRQRQTNSSFTCDLKDVR